MMDQQLTLFIGVEEHAENLIVLDELFANASAYHRSREFFELLQFISKFHQYTPYNAFLLHVQNPKVTFVATPSQWCKRFHRQVKPGSKPLLVIAPMHPVMFVFGLADTEGSPIPEGLIDPYKTNGRLPKRVFENSMEAAQRDGILTYANGQYSKLHAGTASRLPSPVQKELGGKLIEFNFKITMNSDLGYEASFATFVHELGHIYCSHFGKPPGAWWRERQVSDDIVELEAEAVSYLVCKRFGLQTKSEQYLALKAEQDIELPMVSLDTILKVAGKIEKMGNGKYE